MLSEQIEVVGIINDITGIKNEVADMKLGLARLEKRAFEADNNDLGLSFFDFRLYYCMYLCLYVILHIYVLNILYIVIVKLYNKIYWWKAMYKFS
jgi:hypothetical protein